jgi:hypothetical protein
LENSSKEYCNLKLGVSPPLWPDAHIIMMYQKKTIGTPDIIIRQATLIEYHITVALVI